MSSWARVALRNKAWRDELLKLHISRSEGDDMLTVLQIDRACNFTVLSIFRVPGWMILDRSGCRGEGCAIGLSSKAPPKLLSQIPIDSPPKLVSQIPI